MTTWLSLEADSPSADKTAAPGDGCAKTFLTLQARVTWPKCPQLPGLQQL